MTPRLHIDAALAAGAAAPLSADQVHYLKNVLRRGEGEPLRVFNARDGEFEATLAELKKRGGLAALGEKIRDGEPPPPLTLCFAPVKKHVVDGIVRQATELGVGALQPVVTERTNAPKLNLERLQAIATEAAEQCDRVTVPAVNAPAKLSGLIEGWPAGARLLFCDEAGDDPAAQWGGTEGRAAPILEAVAGAPAIGETSWVVLTGPEGGFSPAERGLLRAQGFVTPATLGPRILRADTAAIAALTLIQAALGDWRAR